MNQLFIHASDVRVGDQLLNADNTVYGTVLKIESLDDNKLIFSYARPHDVVPYSVWSQAGTYMEIRRDVVTS